MPDSIIQAVAGEELKYCPRCKTLKPLSEFHKNKSAKDGLQPICKKCRAENDKERHQELVALRKKVSEKPVEVIKTTDGRTLIKKESSDNKALDQYTPREILAELKRRGYVWTEMWIKQSVDYDKI